MIKVCRERNDVDGQNFWEYVLQILHEFKHHGMSDEEDAEELVTRGGMAGIEATRRVLVLKFRNPYFRRLFELVDKTKGLETMIFNGSGKVPMKRIRIDATSNRQPPKGLPRNFLSDEFLETMLPHEKEALCLKGDFELRHFDEE